MARVSRLELRLPDSRTLVWVGAGALAEALRQIESALVGRRIFAVTSRGLRELHGTALEPIAERAGDFQMLEVDDGEAAKTVESAAALWRGFLRGGGKRDSLVVAFGGGSVGDIAGFVAATFLRGIEYVQIPTTLLAQVDAAIGGKTAINLPEAKNSVGAFHQPIATIADTIFLRTLPARQLRSGLFEVVKTAVMLDDKLFDALEEDVEGLLTSDPRSIAPIVEATAAAKIDIVERDPREAGPRRLLNFGHTLGHALESVAMKSRDGTTLEHGEAVGYGMLFALELAHEAGLTAADSERIRNLILRIGLPSLPTDMSVEEIVTRLQRDKKSTEDGLRWALPMAIGKGTILSNLPADFVAGKLGPFLEAASGC